MQSYGLAADCPRLNRWGFPTVSGVFDTYLYVKSQLLMSLTSCRCSTPRCDGLRDYTGCETIAQGDCGTGGVCDDSLILFRYGKIDTP